MVCPNCGNEVPENRFCRMCGWELQPRPTEEPAGQPSAGPAEDSGQDFCPVCGAPVKGKKFCSSCGADFTQRNDSAAGAAGPASDASAADTAGPAGTACAAQDNGGFPKQDADPPAQTPVPNTASGQPAPPEERTPQKKKGLTKWILLAAAVVVAAAVIAVVLFAVLCESTPGDQEYINVVRNGVLSDYGVTYAEVFDDHFDRPSWVYFEGSPAGASETEDVVQFTGTCDWQGASADALVQFVVHLDAETCDLVYVSLDDTGLEEDDAYAFVCSVFEQYLGQESAAPEPDLEEPEETSELDDQATEEEEEVLDLEDYIELSPVDLEARGFTESSVLPGMYAYETEQDYVTIMYTDGTLDNLFVRRGTSYGFHGAFIGQEEDEASGHLTDTYSFLGTVGYQSIWSNPDGSVVLAIDIDAGKVYTIYISCDETYNAQVVSRFAEEEDESSGSAQAIDSDWYTTGIGFTCISHDTFMLLEQDPARNGVRILYAYGVEEDEFWIDSGRVDDDGGYTYDCASGATITYYPDVNCISILGGLFEGYYMPDSVETSDLDDRLTYFFEHCGSQYFTADYFVGFDADMCRLARNGIYAVCGRKFADASLQAYYEQFSWYTPTIEASAFSDTMLNQYMTENRDVILAYEAEQGFR